MSRSAPFADHPIGGAQPCYVIAEPGSNHDGSLARAKELIDVAAAAAADAVKFQLFSAADLYPRNCGTVELASGAHDFFALLQDLELPRTWLPAIAEHAAGAGIEVLYTPFDMAAVDLLVEQRSTLVKIASPELTHIPLLEHVGRAGLATILSTGMSTVAEIGESLAVLVAAGATDVALLHCVTAYPCPPEDANVGAIVAMAEHFDVPIGLSDHTTDPVAAPLLASALGAAIVEKHFTLSRRLSGPDHAYAIEPDELTSMVQAIRRLERLEPTERLAAVGAELGPALVATLRGADSKTVVAAERELAACDRRTLHAVSPITAGDRLGSHNVAVLRGERNLRPGLHPRHWSAVDGAIAARDVAYGDGIVWADLAATS